VKITENI